MLTEILFIVSFVSVVYSYFGYPVSLKLINFIRVKNVDSYPIILNVSFIVTVHNEENRIKEKLNNTLSLDYPKDKFQLIVASDGSDDRTNEIVMNYQDKGVQLLKIPERQGKEHAQKEAVKKANGDILVFSDVATRLSVEGLRQIVSNFSDKSIGAVSGEDRIVAKDNVVTGENLYVKYEMWLRSLESNVSSLVGMSGSFFAARKEICEDFAEDMQSDFRTVLNCIRKGYRAISDPKSIGYYADVSNKTHEFDRKVRTVLRGLTVFFRNIEFLNFSKYGLFSYQYFCHKLLRWLVPIFLTVALLTNFILSFHSSGYLVLFLCQFMFYFLGFFGMKRKNAKIYKYEKIPIYFVTVNLAILLGWYKYFKGERIVLWTPSRR